MPPRRKPRRGRATNLARGPRGRGRDTRLQDEGSQHDGNPGGRGAKFEQEGNNPGGNGTPNQFVVDFVAALTAANILNQPRLDAESRAREITKDFCRMNPPSFDGSSTDPLPMNGGETVLAARRDARRVARAAKNVEAPDIENLTWAEFEKMFENQYFPESYREQLRDKFEKFEQGTMTISEYITQYQALSRFAPELVNTEEKKCRRFEKGLHSSVRRLVMSSKLKVFTEILELARTLKLPRDNVRNAQGNEGRQSMGSSAEFQGTFFYRVWGTLVETTGHLPQCGQEGHIRAHCPHTPSQLRPPPPPRSQTPGACFGCGGFGHVARFCPQKVGARSESGSVQQPRSGQSFGQHQQRGTQSQPHYCQTTTVQGQQGDRGASSSALNPTTQGRVFAVTTAAPLPPPVIATQTLEASIVRGTFLLFNSFAGVLFDSGASHSFIAASFVLALGLETEELNPPLFCRYADRW
ncbi:hypothetical protein Acr_25g0000790 [Actinidia rufa]|uniref:CCHC-type domain-containing protein n=1 Tax=Actinidia rufa TaxID=165716 RepID=A0A7J0GXX0_9ERIC|nr:hypothetical protein Acr_25g0000790 [Actinidia rufa]